MSEKKEKKSSSETLNGFLEKNKVILFSVLGALVAAVVIYVVVVSVSAKSTEKSLTVIEEVTYKLTDASEVSESELAAALEGVTPYLSKGGVVGVRANMVAAEVAFQKKDYAAALDYWKAAGAKGKKSYTAPLTYFNMAVCCEELGNLSEAADSYKKAADVSDFVMKAHALFSLGRVYEALNENEKAAEAYNSLVSANPEDSWAKVAKTRLIDMKIKGNIQ